MGPGRATFQAYMIELSRSGAIPASMGHFERPIATVFPRLVAKFIA